jgi:Protein of unknown function (DUF3455)
MQEGIDMNMCNTNKRLITRKVSLIAGVAALGIALILALPQTAHAQTVTPPPVPTDIQLPAGNEAFLLGHGVGTQNYVCLPSRSIGHVDWTLFTPQATLFSDLGDQLTTHFSSPNPDEGEIVRVTWEDSRDTSTVWARATGVATVSPTAIPWVRLEVVGRAVGPTGGNTLFETTFIQRVNTVGGVAPPTGCHLPTDIGHKAFVPYTADYFFFEKSQR